MTSARDFDLLEFDPKCSGHVSFVHDSFRRSTDCWPWVAFGHEEMVRLLAREMARPRTVTRIITPPGMPDDYSGWVSVRTPDVVVYGFAKYAIRRWGVVTAAIAQLGVELGTRPVGITFWTPACARIMAEKPYQIYFDTRHGYDD